MTNVPPRSIVVDQRLFEFVSTDKEREALEAIVKHGTAIAADKALGMARSYSSGKLVQVRKRAAKMGYAPGHFDAGVAPGFTMGKVTIQRGLKGVERVWERQHPSEEEMMGAFRQSIEDLCADARGLSPIIPPPAFNNDDLLTVIPMGDPHFGLLSWAKETGTDFNLDIAERLTFGAVDRLSSLTPASNTAMLINLGDYFHADDGTNRTPRGGNVLDVDGRFYKIASVGFRAMIRCITRLLEKHENVIVRNNPGNHDPHPKVMLDIAVGAYFHNEPRVHVDQSPSPFYYYRWGSQLIGTTHGDGPKLADLPLQMANDVPLDWAAAIYRVWLCGHVHHDQVKEGVGCRMETMRTMAAGDAWHKYHGYNAGRDMKAIIYHRKFGEVNRIRCGVEMLEP